MCQSFLRNLVVYISRCSLPWTARIPPSFPITYLQYIFIGLLAQNFLFHSILLKANDSQRKFKVHFHNIYKHPTSRRSWTWVNSQTHQQTRIRWNHTLCVANVNSVPWKLFRISRPTRSCAPFRKGQSWLLLSTIASSSPCWYTMATQQNL